MRTLKNKIKDFGERVLELFTQFDMHELITSPSELRKGIDTMSEMKMAKGQGEMETNENGVKRESNKNRGRFDLIPYEALEELAKWYELGAEKYGDRNWEKGISVKDCTNRMARHSSKACNGWMDEGPFAHYVAVIWNAMAAITGIKRNPYLNDHFRDEYLKELGLTDTMPDPSNKYVTDESGQINPTNEPLPIGKNFFYDFFPISEEVPEHARSHATSQKFSWEHDKPRLITDKAEEIKVAKLNTGLFISCQFKNTADLEEFQANLALMGIETTGGNHDVPTDGGFVRDDGKDQGAKEG